MPSILDSQPAPVTPNAPAAPSGGGGSILDHAIHAGQSAGNAIGDVVTHPGRAIMNAVNAPGRASKSLLAGHGLSATTGASDDSNRADIRDRLHLGEAGYDKAPQWLKGVTDFGIDTLADPMTYAPGADIVKVGSRALGMANRGLHVGETLSKIPGVKAGAEKVADLAGSVFDPHNDTKLFSEHGQNAIDRTTNIHQAAAQRAKLADDRILAQHQAAIRSGERPDAVKALLGKYRLAPADVAEAKTPADLRDAIDTARSSLTRAAVRSNLERNGLLRGSVDQRAVAADPLRHNRAANLRADKALGHDAYFKDPARADEARDALAKALERRPEGFAATAPGKLVGATNEKLKAAFLALPGAHMANLTNLAYNAQGPGVAARGLLRAVPIALGKTGPKTQALLDTLEAHGAEKAYAPLYGEASKFAPFRLGARAFNALQDKTLNATESGLRAEMLAKDLSRGASTEDSVRSMHRALGSNPDTGLTRGLNQLPASQFPRFHTQTAIGSFLRALVEHPGRVTTPEHALGMTPDSDASEPTADGDPHYHLSTPTAAGLRLMENPYKYLTGASTLGKLIDVPKAVSALAQGKPDAAGAAGLSAIKALLGAIPGEQLLKSGYDLLSGGVGQAGESPGQDLLSGLLGGYYAKK